MAYYFSGGGSGGGSNLFSEEAKNTAATVNKGKLYTPISNGDCTGMFQNKSVDGIVVVGENVSNCMNMFNNATFNTAPMIIFRNSAKRINASYALSYTQLDGYSMPISMMFNANNAYCMFKNTNFTNAPYVDISLGTGSCNAVSMFHSVNINCTRIKLNLLSGNNYYMLFNGADLEAVEDLSMTNIILNAHANMYNFAFRNAIIGSAVFDEIKNHLNNISFEDNIHAVSIFENAQFSTSYINLNINMHDMNNLIMCNAFYGTNLGYYNADVSFSNIATLLNLSGFFAGSGYTSSPTYYQTNVQIQNVQTVVAINMFAGAIFGNLQKFVFNCSNVNRFSLTSFFANRNLLSTSGDFNYGIAYSLINCVTASNMFRNATIPALFNIYNSPNNINCSNMYFQCHTTSTAPSVTYRLPVCVSNCENMFYYSDFANMSGTLCIKGNASTNWAAKNFFHMFMGRKSGGQCGRLNIWCNNRAALNGNNYLTNSLFFGDVTWTTSTNYIYNTSYNVYIYNNYSNITNAP